MSIKENVAVAYTAWKMNCPTPRAYRWVKHYLSNLDTK